MQGSASTDLVELTARLISNDGVEQSNWPGLTFFRASHPVPRSHAVYRPCLCFVAQGKKRLFVDDEVLEYDSGTYLVVSLPLPVEGAIIKATARRPCYAVLLEVDTAVLSQLTLQMAEEGWTTGRVAKATRGVFTAAMTGPLKTALAQFLATLDSPMDRRVLGPGAMRAVLYQVLLGEQGDRLRALALADSGAQRITRVMHYIQENLDQPLDVPSIAEKAGMGVSTFHHAFKAATAMSPIQYQKKLRLHRARSLMISDGLAAGEAAFNVGYSSQSQFSREFKRMFGMPPSRVAESVLYELPER